MVCRHKYRYIHITCLYLLLFYVGFRVIAMSILPISSSTIVYGSSDAGKHIYNRNEDLAMCMQRAAAILNLRAHVVGSGGQKQLLCSAVDVEGHRGKDGRLYLVDFR